MGASLAWLGTEDDFADPPYLFVEGHMGDGTYAALAPSIGFVCSAFLGEPFDPVPQEVLHELHQLAERAIAQQIRAE